MNVLYRQLGLFDQQAPADRTDATLARARMRQMIDEISATDVPPWTDQTGVILRDGAFKRAMRLVPSDEAEALWAEFHAHMERLYAIWTESRPAP